MLAGSPQYRLLGPLQVVVDGREVTVSAAKQRTLLATLLLRANTTVTTEELVDRLWEGEPPAGARDTVRAYVMRLRNLIGPLNSIVTTPSGYLIRVQPNQLDLLHVKELMTEPGGLHEAWSLWRGPALSDVPSDSLRRDELPALEELRLHVLTRSVDEDLAQGRHAEVVAALHRAVGEHPLHEGLAGRLMLALHRSGRGPEALEQYARLRRRLADELGTDPGAELRELHRRMLTEDPTLMPTPTPTVPVPRQLPAMPRWFTGRAHELVELDHGGAVVISAIGGAGGIGKTWLALHWAHRSLSCFPDGQLYVNLRGFDPVGTPLEPAVAVRGFLDALGVTPDAIPSDVESQIGMYRSLVADRRVLVVLDNARDTAQVEPLLPGGAACTTLVTSRHQLAGLVVNHGATLLTLDVLDEAEACQLLAGRLGESRVAAEPDAVRELVERCAGLPLALGIVAARAAMQPTMPLAELAAQLREASLDALDAGELTVNLRAVFACSYRALSAEAAQTFRLLGLAPGPDIGLPAATNLTGHGVEQLAELEAAHLVQQHVPGRYRMHDLVRLFAAEQAAPDDDGKALRRLVDFYLHTAHAGDHQLYRYRVRIELAAAGEGVIPLPLPDLESALAWFTAEHACLLAAQQLAVDRGWDTSAWQLAWALVSFQVRQKRTQDSVTVRRIALAAAERLGDREAVAMTHQMLGQALGSVGAAVQGLTHLRQVLVYGVEIGDVTRQAHAHRGLAWLHEQAGDLPSALSHAREQARLAATLNNRSWEATAINAMGWFEAQLGDYEAATAHCVEALTMLRAEGDLDGEANTLDSLGYIAQQTGDMAKALEHLRAATALFRRIGNSSQQVETMIRTGDCELALGLPEQARRTWEQALATSQHPQTIKTIEQRLRELADDGRR